MKTKKNAKHKRAKLAMLPILMGVLGYILLAPASPEEEGAQASLATLPAAELAAPSSAQAGPHATASTWPDVDLKFLSLANPLAGREPAAGAHSPEHFTSTSATINTSSGVRNVGTPQAAVDSLQHVARDLSGSQVNYVFKSSRRKAIMLGDQMFEQGAQIGETVRLHDIQDNALVLMEFTPSLPRTQWMSKLHELANQVGHVLRNVTVPLPATPASDID